LKIPLFYLPSSHRNVLLSCHCFLKSHCSSCHPIVTFDCFQNLFVLLVIQSRFSDRNILLSCHCF
jgi:hypothetical protein